MLDFQSIRSHWPNVNLRRATLLVLAIVVAAVGIKIFLRAGVEMEAEHPVAAGAADNPNIGTETGLPIPRFVSLGSDKVNIRTGPGARYPIAWVYLRRDLPVEVVAEYEYYRKIRDSDGAEGWVHKNLISGRRYALVIGGAVRVLQKEPGAGSIPRALVEPGVLGRLQHCRADWCEISVKGYHGYIQRQFLFGVLPGETVE